MAISIDFGKFAKFVKTTELKITAIENDSSEETAMIKVSLFDNITAKGSNMFANKEMQKTDNMLYVAGDDVELFKKGLVVDEQGEPVVDSDGCISYKGDLKLDVAKPKGRLVDGEFQVTKPMRIFLTSVSFAKKGDAFRSENNQKRQNALLELFGGGAPDPNKVDGGKPAPVKEPTQVVADKQN